MKPTVYKPFSYFKYTAIRVKGYFHFHFIKDNNFEKTMSRVKYGLHYNILIFYIHITY